MKRYILLENGDTVKSTDEFPIQDRRWYCVPGSWVGRKIDDTWQYVIRREIDSDVMHALEPTIYADVEGIYL